MNIIFMLADDLGYGDLGCYGNTVVSTPHIDALARDGIQLTQQYTASPLCAPARAALQTGRYSHRTGGVDVPSNRGFDRISLAETTWGDAFKEANYATGLIGKWHSGLHDARYHPNQRGYDEFVGFLNGGMDYWKWVIEYNGTPRWSDGRYLTDVFTDEAIQFVDRHKDESFFLFLNYNAPHGPMQAPDHLLKNYKNKPDLNENTKIAYAMIESMDTGIGQIRDHLKKSGLDKNTLFVVSSDNGGFYGYVEPVMKNEGPIHEAHPMHPNQMGRFNAGFRGGKMDVLEGGIRVPGIACCPEVIPAGQSSNAMVDGIDWFPTLMEIAGIESPKSLPLDGVSCLPLLKGEAREIVNKRCWQFNRYDPQPKSNACIREGKWKLYWPQRLGANCKDPGDNEFYTKGIQYPHQYQDIDMSYYERDIGPILEPMLYNLDADPGETTDLSFRFPGIRARLEKRWESWWSDVINDYNVSLHYTGRTF